MKMAADTHNRRIAALQIAHQLHATAIQVLRRVQSRNASAVLSPARLSALSVAVFAGPVTLGRLAEAERVSAPTMTRLVSALEEEGLLTRIADTRDARVVWLRATRKGKRILEAGRRRRIAALATSLRALNARDRALVLEAMTLVSQAIAGVDANSRRFAAARAR